MQPFTEAVIAIIRSIPAGRVMTYGQIAALAGSPRAARQVVRILHAMSSRYDLPWHRVVNKRGEIALTEEEARFTQGQLLRDEGVTIENGSIADLERFQFQPKVQR